MRSSGSWLRSPMAAAVFLMATSAIGPGFLTQTAVFTGKLQASFGFVILLSIILDIGAQLNIWRILSVSGLRAQELANRVYSGAGHLLTILVVVGGLAFNIGNLAGTGLGLNTLTGLDSRWGAAISAILAIAIFILRDALRWMDMFTKALGILMILLTMYVVFKASPPWGLAIQKTLLPDTIDFNAILTLVGGTVGGYISFAGAHRLLDSGKTGLEHIPQVSRAATSAILLASLMRILLFLAALGVAYRGIELATNNPAASVFQFASGPIGYRIFGMVMWSAAITSVIGSTYTSISFLKTLHPSLSSRHKPLIILFIAVSAVVFIIRGQPVQTLVFVGWLNGLILPFALGIVLIAAFRPGIVGSYRHPRWMFILGLITVLATLFFALTAIFRGLTAS